MSKTMMVAETIRTQLGAGTLAMLGASQLVGSADALQFAIKGSRKCNKVRIVLDAGSDTYTVEFWQYSRKTFDCKLVASVDGVHVDSLHSTIESKTGLYTRI